MAGLMGQTEKRKGLQRAGDADTDPASISDSEKDSANASSQGSFSDAATDSANDGESGSTHTRDSASESTGQSGSATDGGRTGKAASATGSHKGSGKARESSSRKAGASASNKASRKPRRGVGRPAGPERQAITVRVLAEHDAQLTEAWNERGMRPQQVIDQALAEWFERHLETQESAG